jgi:hypothetical protein
MKIYSAHGVNEFVVCLGYKGYMVKEYFANYYLHETDVTLDGAETAERLRGRGVAADLIAANNVLAHVPRRLDFVEGLQILLKPSRHSARPAWLSSRVRSGVWPHQHLDWWRSRGARSALR